MNDFIVGPFEAFCLLLLISGIAKMARPRSAAFAMQAMSVPRPVATALALAAVEVVVGSLGVVVGGRLIASCIALLYTVFTATVVYLIQERPGVPCGCFGSRSGAPGLPQVTMNAAGMFVALVGAATAPSGLGTALTMSRNAMVRGEVYYLALVGVIVVTMLLIDTVLSGLSSDTRRRMQLAASGAATVPSMSANGGR